MPTLSNADRAQAWAELMRRESAARNTIDLTKPDLRAALNAVDDWVEANAASFNSALPQPARSSLSARQKAMLLMMVVARRFEVA